MTIDVDVRFLLLVGVVVVMFVVGGLAGLVNKWMDSPPKRRQ